VLTIEYRTEPGAVAAWLPDRVEPAEEEPDAVALVFADWQSRGTGSEETFDPVRSQYKECFFVVRCRHGGETYSRCLMIWVDKDFALARGWFQGYPKKLGSIWMSRPATVGRGGPRLEPGGVFAASLAANDRRLAEARVWLKEPSDGAGFVNALPMLHSRWLPAIAADDTDAYGDLVTLRTTEVEVGQAWRGDAQVSLFPAPGEELDSLPVRELLGAFWRQVGATFVGGAAV
jgi:acetoacetate decarboxylase